MDNERRADLGLAAVRAAALDTNVWNVEDAETSIRDVLAYIAHLCDRCGLNPDETFAAGTLSYFGDAEDGPAAETRFDSERSFAELDPGAHVPIVLCVRDPDHDNEYTVAGAVRVIDVDMGRAFNGAKDIDPSDPEAQEWAASMRLEVDDLPTGNPVRLALEGLLSELGL